MYLTVIFTAYIIRERTHSTHNGVDIADRRYNSQRNWSVQRSHNTLIIRTYCNYCTHGNLSHEPIMFVAHNKYKSHLLASL